MGQAVNTVEYHPYLGVKLDRKLNFCVHMRELVNKLKNRRSQLNWLINRRSKLPTECKSLLYKQLIAPVWQYALPICGSLTSQTQITRIVVFQDITLRTIANVQSFTETTKLARSPKPMTNSLPDLLKDCVITLTRKPED